MTIVQNQKEAPSLGEERGIHGGQRTVVRRPPFSTHFGVNPIEFLTMSPSALIHRFADELDRLRAGAGEAVAWVPAIEVWRDRNQLVISADLPGVQPGDLHAEVTGEGLLIEGERRREHEERGEGYQRTERSYGKFRRLIRLPEDINAENVKAEFQGGVLKVYIPVRERQPRRRRIPVTAVEEETAQANVPPWTSGAEEEPTHGEPATAGEGASTGAPRPTSTGDGAAEPHIRPEGRS
ncbi:MAG: Hsp20/alpha crystallin family protein [Bryobacteraceae bacterium]|nr:Hsp20/alpha crystallin family protein [Bryobacteraceae bacterium]